MSIHVRGQTFHEISAIIRQRAEESGLNSRILRGYDIANDAEQYYVYLIGQHGQASFQFTSKQFEAVGGLEAFSKLLRETIGRIGPPSGEAVGI